MNTPEVSPSLPQAKKKDPIWIVFAVIMVSAFFFTIYSLFWPDMAREKLLREGLPATAIVLDADPTGNVRNAQPEVRLRLKVSPPGGTEYETEAIMMINPIYVPEFQPGKMVKVRYDKEDRSKVAVEETESGQR
ncbi:hypothetical protein KBD34_04410 [Patescibacteria group bacterium]|nr:hypothetical protein [Patescibacteria group bacterium]